MNQDCPIKAPQLLKAKSTVETCSSCGAWAFRYPTFMGNDGFWECDKCGCTSVNVRDGRDFGPKSKQWVQIVKWFEDLFTEIPKWDFETVETIPPMSTLDWDALSKWEQAHGIYRWVIRVDATQSTE